MNSNHENEKAKNGKDRRLLDAELDQLDQLYRSEESIEPPDLLDQAILNKARRSVESKNSWLDFGWIHAVTTVALVVLTFSIFTTQRETGEFEPTVGKSIDRVPSEAIDHLSGRAESDRAKSVQAESDRAKSVQAESGRAESDQVITGRVRADQIRTDQNSLQQQTREPASAASASASASAQAAKRQPHSNTTTESFEISQQKLLDRILTLKHAGDDRWVEELADFKKLYPDFPLPDELENEELQNIELQNKDQL